MQPSAILLFASLGAISVLLMLYVYIFLHQRRLFLALWFVGWLFIGLNYALDAFFPDLLRQNRWILSTSLCSYFCANFLISWGVFRFLKTKIKRAYVFGAGFAWLIAFVMLYILDRSDLHLIQYTNLSAFALAVWTGTAMIGAAKRFGKLAFILGLLNIAWVANTLFFSYILQMPQMAPYYVSQLILILNAIGLIQLFFKEQKDEIERGLAHIKYLTYHDELTGLYNKAYFDKTIQQMADDEDCLPVSVIVGDMNGLKFVNDVFGHQEGDNWLKRMAGIIRQSSRRNDVVARWGGDEFAIILPKTDKETALAIRNEINTACRSFQEADILLSISLGVATKTDLKADLTMVLKEAEDIMYETKIVEGKEARRSIAETLGKLLQKKGYEAREHNERLKALAGEFAQALRLPKENLNNLVQAIDLHDIGKIGIQESIVLKETPLDEAEWSAMKKHVEIGYRIAHASGEFANLADIILYHHEWWNGQGYPLGLKDEEIPLLSRIISILDAFDVMTHDQPYKRAVSVDEARNELHLKAGTQFDPVLVPAFIKMVISRKPVYGKR